MKEVKDLIRLRTLEGTQEVEKCFCSQLDQIVKQEKVTSVNLSGKASHDQESQYFDPFTCAEPKP
jgi:hypothetical protein